MKNKNYIPSSKRMLLMNSIFLLLVLLSRCSAKEDSLLQHTQIFNLHFFRAVVRLPHISCALLQNCEHFVLTQNILPLQVNSTLAL